MKRLISNYNLEPDEIYNNDLDLCENDLYEYACKKDIDNFYRTYLNYLDLLDLGGANHLYDILSDEQLQYMRNNKPFKYRNINL